MSDVARTFVDVGRIAFPAILAAFAWVTFRGTRPAQRLSDEQVERVRVLPERRRNQHHVDVTLEDGRVVEGVYIAYGRYVVPGFWPWQRRVRAESIRDFRPHS